MKIQKRTIYVIKYTDDMNEKKELIFNSRYQAVIWLNRAILDYGRMDARLIVRKAS
jgi:hypothetical protein